MKAREVLIALHIKYDGDWDRIYRDVILKNVDEDLEGYVNEEAADYFITILDEDYPERLKHRNKPPFVIQEVNYGTHEN